MGRSVPHKETRRKRTVSTNAKSLICGNINYGDTLAKLLDRLTSLKSLSPGEQSGSYSHGELSVPVVTGEAISSDKAGSMVQDITANPDDPTPQTNASSNNADISLHKRWMELIPNLVPDYLDYMSRSCAKTVQAAPSTLTQDCIAQCRSTKSTQILCLFYDREPSWRSSFKYVRSCLLIPIFSRL